MLACHQCVFGFNPRLSVVWVEVVVGSHSVFALRHDSNAVLLLCPGGFRL